MKNEAESQAVFAVSYLHNVRGRAMLLDSTVPRTLAWLFPRYPVGGGAVDTNDWCITFTRSNLNLNLNLNSLLVKRQIDNPSPGAVTGGN